MSQIYLVHGNMEAEVSNARYQLVCRLLPNEERDTGLTEITGPGNQRLSLQRCLSEITGELGTSSFLAGSRRVVVVYDLAELMSAAKPGTKKSASKSSKKKKDDTPPPRTPESALVEFFEEVLPSTENVVIFACLENDEKQRTVSTTSELYRYIRRKGQIIEHREKPVQYELENYLLAGNTVAAVTLFREWQKRAGSDSGARSKMHSTLVNHIELLFQARCVQEAREARIPEAQVLIPKGFPALGSLPGWKADKIHNAAQRYSMARLKQMLEAADKLQRVMWPSGDEDYVLNWEEYYEGMIVGLGIR